MQEFVQVLTLLLSLADFGVAPNPQAPAPAEVLAYAVEDADAFAYVDTQAIVPRNVAAFTKLPSKLSGKDAPEVREALNQAVRELADARARAKAELGIDVVDDVLSAALWIDVDAPMPRVLLAVRGRWPADALAKAPVFGGRLLDFHGHKAVRMGPLVAAISPRGQLLVGNEDLVSPRLDKGWKPPARTGTSAVARQAAALVKKPFFAIVTTPSVSAAERMASTLGDESPATMLLKGQRRAHVALHARGVSWSYVATTDAGYHAAVLGSEGVLDVFRAGHFMTRGMARIALAGAHGFRDKHPALAAVADHEAEILALVAQFSGDGRFAARIDKNPGQRTVSVEATGKKISDVLPSLGLVPMLGAGLWLGISRSADAEIATKSAGDGSAVPVEAIAPVRASRPAGRPLDVREVYRQAKQRRGMQ